MYDAHIERPLTQLNPVTQRRYMQSSWLLFLWYMPDDATEGVTVHSFFIRLQPSVNRHAQLQPLCSAALVPNVLPRGNEGLDKPCAVIEAS